MVERVGLRPSDVVGVAVMVACRSCEGAGWRDDKDGRPHRGPIFEGVHPCSRCNGRGEEPITVPLRELRDLLLA